MSSIPLKHTCLSIILIWFIVSLFLISRSGVLKKVKSEKKNIFLIGKNRHGIGGKGGYFQLGIRPKFGP